MGSVISQISRASAVDMASAQASFVQNTLKQHKVVIFSKSSCPYCTMAKDQFKKLSVPYHVVELDQRNDCSEIQDVLGEMTGARTVPRCFIDGTFIGGGTDVKKMYETGALQKYFS
ncbi:uncharacterized protein LOC106091238 [Stomoxys calcitrans]|uniref:Glutaredoxin-2, mitochondrial n=1 Tax=Stomoxys calcitrans TaxID=35570 RepID=A0A1I8Q6F6_STOCA|nr:uncharacterized protein LOC106091238 [Stomoxys calcitrans]